MKAVESWTKIRSDMLRVAIESEALPKDSLCGVCAVSVATHRCLQCGHKIFFCQQCYEIAHNKTNIFHVGEIWKVNVDNHL